MELENNVLFWQKLDTLILSSELMIERKKNTAHPDYPNLIYPVDYGFFSDTVSNDAEELDAFCGTSGKQRVQAVVVCVDILQKDVEVKVLIGCTEEEELEILRFLNQTDFQKAFIVRRGIGLPAWAQEE